MTAQNKKTQTEEKHHQPISLIVGQILTVVWVFVVGIYAYCRSEKFSELEPNAVGDFIAGAAAPLAFLWLVVAVFLQKVELGLQRTELKESREAQQRQANETAELVNESKRSGQLALQTKKEQQWRDDEARLDRLIDALGQRVRLRSGDLLLNRGQGHHRIFGSLTKDDGPDDIFRKANSELAGSLDMTNGGDVRLVQKELAIRELESMTTAADTILNRSNSIAFEVLKARIEMIELDRFRDSLAKLVSWSREHG